MATSSWPDFHAFSCALAECNKHRAPVWSALVTAEMFCRDVTSTSELSSRFLRQKINSEGYFRHETVVVAPKSMVGTGCMLGAGTRLGEKSTLKRSVVGARCVIGSHVKLLNSVVLDDVQIDDNSVVQNCILCSGSHIQVGSLYCAASLFDSTILPTPEPKLLTNYFQENQPGQSSELYLYWASLCSQAARQIAGDVTLLNMVLSLLDP